MFNCVGGSCTQAAKLTASDGEVGDQHGRSVAISGQFIVVGAPFHDDNGSDSGAAYVYTCETSQSKGNLLPNTHKRLAAAKRAQALENCTEITKLVASDGGIADYFGLDVSMYGKTIVVGAPGNIARGSAGAAYVFTCDDTSCEEVAKLTASDGEGGDQFGLSVSVWGSTVVVGAPSDDDAGASSGAAYVFTCADDSCTEVAKLTSSDNTAVDWFGASVDVAVNTIIVGAPNSFVGGIHSGSAYVFDCSDGVCTQLAQLSASDAAKWNQFGASVAVADDDTIVVGAALSGPPTHSGGAFVYIRDGDNWTQKPKLNGGSDAEASDFFGASVDISGDKVVIGVPRDNESGRNSGSACVFVRVPIVSKPGRFTSSRAPSRGLAHVNPTAAGWYVAVATVNPLPDRGALVTAAADVKDLSEPNSVLNTAAVPEPSRANLNSERLSAGAIDEVMGRLPEDVQLWDLFPWLQQGQIKGLELASS